MDLFATECQRLAPLETFDPEAFIGDDETPQDLCNLMLCFALIYDDWKDSLFAFRALETVKPQHPLKRNRTRGLFWGLHQHVTKTLLAILHELLNLIRENDELFEEKTLSELIRRLPRGFRDAWDAAREVARGVTPKSALGNTLLRVRNKVSSHYDPKELLRGYRQHFFGTTRIDDRAYISRGSNMAETRFYFADASVTGYLTAGVGGMTFEELISEANQCLEALNPVLMHLVVSFIQYRKFAFRQTHSD